MVTTPTTPTPCMKAKAWIKDGRWDLIIILTIPTTLMVRWIVQDGIIIMVTIVITVIIVITPTAPGIQDGRWDLIIILTTLITRWTVIALVIIAITPTAPGIRWDLIIILTTAITPTAPGIQDGRWDLIIILTILTTLITRWTIKGIIGPILETIRIILTAAGISIEITLTAPGIEIEIVVTTLTGLIENKLRLSSKIVTSSAVLRGDKHS